MIGRLQRTGWASQSLSGESASGAGPTARAGPLWASLMARKRGIFLGTAIALILMGAGVGRLALHRGPREGEIRDFVLGRTEGATGAVIVRNDMDGTGVVWLRVRMSDGTSDELGYEFVVRWVWPWQSYLDDDRRSAGM